MALIPMIRITTDWRRMSFTRTHTLVTHTVTGPINEQIQYQPRVLLGFYHYSEWKIKTHH